MLGAPFRSPPTSDAGVRDRERTVQIGADTQRCMRRPERERESIDLPPDRDPTTGGRGGNIDCWTTTEAETSGKLCSIIMEAGIDVTVRGRNVVYLVLLTGGLAQGQVPTGSIAGTVADPSGAPIAGAAISVRNAATNVQREIAADLSGSFRVTNLAPGSYEVTITKPGFHTVRERGLAVELDRTAQLALVMQVGSVTETLEVLAKQRAIDSHDGGEIDELLQLAELADIVQDSRTITDLAYLASGVARRARGGLGSGFAVAGARSDNTNFIVDGFSDYDPRTGGAQAMPNYDSIEEFRVQTAGSAAEYGRMAGGVIDMVPRNGTNQLHGSAFEFFRSDALSARNFFDTQKSELLRNQFGTTVAGPLTIPRLYSGKDRSFFLASWESLRHPSGDNRFSQAPTTLERSGDFSQSVDAAGNPVAVKDPRGGFFPQNRIPQDRINSVAQALAG